MTDIFLQLQDLSAGYHQRKKTPRAIVQPFTESLCRGQLVCLIGPNGAGKSTLLRTIAGMQEPISGEVRLDGQSIHAMSASERAKRLSVVLTQKMEIGLFTGYELVAMGRYPYTAWTGQLSEQDHCIVRQAIKRVDAEKLSSQSFNTMSDGERQKIMIARALAQEPDLLVLDEPTAFLDLPRRVECMVLLRKLAHQTGCTIVLSTHDLDLALRCADHIWLLPYSGHIQAGLPEDLVLTGAFESAFHSASLTFDRKTGTFIADAVGTQRIKLQGEGTQYYWTKRALEREGYGIASEHEADAPLIRITGSDEWQLTMHSVTECFASLNDLMTTLRTQ